MISFLGSASRGRKGLHVVTCEAITRTVCYVRFWECYSEPMVRTAPEGLLNLERRPWLFSSLFMRNSVVFVFMYKSLPWPVGVPMCCGWSLHPTASCVTRVFGYYLYCFSLSFFFVPIFCLFFDINPIFEKCFLVPASFQNKSFAERSSFPHQFIVLFRTVAKGWGSGTWLRFLGINQETSRSYVCHV